VAFDDRPAESAGESLVEVSVGPSARISGSGFDTYAASAVVTFAPQIQIEPLQARAPEDDETPETPY